MVQVGIERSLRQLLEEPLPPFVSILPIIMALRCNLDVDTLGHNLRLGRVRDDGVDPSRGSLAELEEEWGLVGQFDLLQHVMEQDPGNFHTSGWVANNLQCVQVLYPVDGD